MGGSTREMKRIVIVGASSGLGLEVAKLLLAEGHTLGVAARREDRLMALKQEAPDRVDVATIDVTAADAGTRLRQLIDRMGAWIYIFMSRVSVSKTVNSSRI